MMMMLMVMMMMMMILMTRMRTRMKTRMTRTMMMTEIAMRLESFSDIKQLEVLPLGYTPPPPPPPPHHSNLFGLLVRIYTRVTMWSKVSNVRMTRLEPPTFRSVAWCEGHCASIKSNIDKLLFENISVSQLRTWQMRIF